MNQAKENSEPVKNPWSIKGIKPNNREAAKQIAGENGLTIGEWINNLIEEADNKSDSEKALLHALDNQPVNQDDTEIQKPKAESLRDIYIQYGNSQQNSQRIDPETDSAPITYSDNEDGSPFSNRADDMNQPENLGINYVDAPQVPPAQNETSRLALAMEMLNRKLEIVSQPAPFIQPTAAPFVQAAPVPLAHNNNVYAPIPLVTSDRSVENLARRLEDGEARYERKSERIANTLEDLKEAQNTIHEKLRRIEGNDNNQRTIHSLQALETSLDSIMRQLSDTNLRTTRIEQELVSEKNGRLTPADVEKILEKSVNEINSNVATEFGKFNERLANVEEFNNKSVEHSEKTNASMRDALVELSARLVNLEGEDNERMRQDLESRISAVIGKINDIEENIENIVAKTQAQAQEKYSGIIRELNERIETSEKGTIGAIENIGNKLVSTAEIMDQRIREIEEINANTKDSNIAVKMEIGKLSNAIDQRLNDLESSSSVVVNKANAHLNTIAEQLNSRLSVFETRSRELEDRIKKQENTLEDRFESAHEDISELVRKNTEESGKLIDNKLSHFETRLSAAQDMAQSITKPLHETLVDLVDRLENMEVGSKNNVYSEAIKPANYSYQLNPAVDTQSDIKLEMLDEQDEIAPLLVAEPDEASIPNTHIEAVSKADVIEKAADPFGIEGFAALEGNDLLTAALEEFDFNEVSEVPDYEVPEYSVPEYELPLNEAPIIENKPSIEEVLSARKDFKIPSEGRLYAETEVKDNGFPLPSEDEEFNFFNEANIEETDFIHHGNADDSNKIYDNLEPSEGLEDLTALSEFEGDYNPHSQEIAQSKTYEFDNNLGHEEESLHPARKPFGADYLEKARNAAMSAAHDKHHNNGKVKKKPMAASSKDGLEKTKKQKPNKLDKLQSVDSKGTDHKPVVSPFGVALAGVLVASGAYAGYNYLQQQQVTKSAAELPAAIKNHEPVTNGQAATPDAAVVDNAKIATPVEPVATTPVPVVATNNVVPSAKATGETKAVVKSPEFKTTLKSSVSTENKAVIPAAKKVVANNAPVIASAANQPAAKTVYGQAVSLEQSGNFKAAAEMYSKAAASGDARAMNKLSKMFERGQGVPKDLSKAKVLTEKAALAGSRQAQHNLGVYYADGEGTERNYTKAAESFRKAAKRGMTDSQFNLGAMAEKGIGTDKNQKEAYYWYSLAAKSGDNDAKSRAKEVSIKLSPTDKAETDRRINTFRPEQGGYE